MRHRYLTTHAAGHRQRRFLVPWSSGANFGAGFGASATCCAALQHDGQHLVPASALARDDHAMVPPALRDALVPSGPWWYSRSAAVMSTQRWTFRLVFEPASQHAHLVTHPVRPRLRDKPGSLSRSAPLAGTPPVTGSLPGLGPDSTGERQHALPRPAPLWEDSRLRLHGSRLARIHYRCGKIRHRRVSSRQVGSLTT